MMLKNKTGGFTLIELLVVIAIIGILASVVLGSLNDARAGAKQTTAVQAAKQILVQAEIYRNSQNSRRPSIGDMRKGWIRSDVANRTCADLITGTISDFEQEFLALCQNIENNVPQPTNTAYMYWGLRERNGAVGWNSSHWSDKDFAISIRLDDSKFVCMNTQGVVQEGTTWGSVHTGCRDVTN